MSTLFSMIELTEFTATAYRHETASNQPTRRGRPVVVPTSWPRAAIPRPTSSWSSVGNGPEPAASRPVLVGRPDPATRRPDARVGEPHLTRRVDRLVVRQDHVAGKARPQSRHVDSARGEAVELVDEGRRVDDDPGADDRDDVRVEDPRRHEVELEHLVAQHQRVAGVVAALIPDDDLGLLREEVGRLALALVAPLEP